MWCAGKCGQDCFYVLLNFYGRKGILHMQPKKKQLKKQKECWMYMQILLKNLWPAGDKRCKNSQ